MLGGRCYDVGISEKVDFKFDMLGVITIVEMSAIVQNEAYAIVSRIARDQAQDLILRNLEFICSGREFDFQDGNRKSIGLTWEEYRSTLDD